MRSQLSQRADYTHKFNSKTGRHGWLRLTPAYSLKIVEELVAEFDRPMRVLDPFCGTATTALSAAYHGHDSVTTDINPFLVWLGRAKTARYELDVVEGTRDAAARAIGLVSKRRVKAEPPPPIHNIERWWSPEALEFLCLLRRAIDQVSSPTSQERDLLLVAFCRTLISVSNASFNHQSMSFKDAGQAAPPILVDLSESYLGDVRFVLEGAKHNPSGTSTVIMGDSRAPHEVLEGRFDCIITSPPYANRMSYIRELRPYMYWLGFLESGREAGEMDWTAIGGTWGVATSRLSDWARTNDRFKSSTFEKVLGQIAHQDNKNGRLLSNYVAKYVDDMWSHMQGLPKILAPKSEVHYIVGNSTFYGVLLSVEDLYADMLKELGFQSVECRPIRKRNSKKELIEFDVVARWKPAEKPVLQKIDAAQ
jgi:hypothetical protein